MTPEIVEHAELGASSADRWINCPGSVRASRGMPDPQSPYAVEGTAAHTLANMALARELPTDTWLDTTLHGVLVTEEMCAAVQVFVDAVLEVVRGDPKAVLYTERKFSLAALNPPVPMYGTADVVVWLPATRTLVVFDLKYGMGVVVEVQDNPQTLYYALGAILDLERQRELFGQMQTVRTVIVQPRIPHPDGLVRAAVYTYEDVVAFAVELLGYARATLAPTAPLVPGSWCRFCRAAGQCPALKSQAMAVAQVEFDALPADLPPAPTLLPVTVLAEILDKADLLEDWITGCRAHAIALLERGDTVPGYKLVDKRKTRRWVAPSLTLDWARENGVNPDELLTAPELKSPAQVEKVLKPLKLALPTELIAATSSGVTLAPIGDARPEVKLLTAGEEFAPVEESGAQVIDLMEALKSSLAKNGSRK